MRLLIDTSLLEFLVIADADALQRYEDRKPMDRVSVSSEWAGWSAVPAVRSGEGRGVGPAGVGALRTIAAARERLEALEVELACVRGRLGEAA